MGTRTIKLTLAYDGAAYHGWQAQPGVPTVQGSVAAAIGKITGESVELVGSSRTDAGVHALGQVASFRTDSLLPADVLRKALAAHLPHDIAAVAVEDVPEWFHAIGSTLRKRYRYLLHDAPAPNVFLRRHSWHVRQRLDVPLMQAAAQTLVGRHDFASFETRGPNTRSSVRTIFSLNIERGRAGEGAPPLVAATDDLVVLEVEGDGFLYNMVRTITGTLVEVGRRRRPVEWVAEVLAARDRRAAGTTAPAEGLFLVEIVFATEPEAAVAAHAWRRETTQSSPADNPHE